MKGVFVFFLFLISLETTAQERIEVNYFGESIDFFEYQLMCQVIEGNDTLIPITNKLDLYIYVNGLAYFFADINYYLYMRSRILINIEHNTINCYISGLIDSQGVMHFLGKEGDCNKSKAFNSLYYILD